MRHMINRQLRYCTHCNETTSQVRLANDELWRCSACEREMIPTPDRNRTRADLQASAKKVNEKADE